MSVRDEIIELLSTGPKTAKEMLTLPYNRNTIQGYLKIMVEGEELYRFGSGRATCYSLDNVKPIFNTKAFPQKKVVPLKLPDLPPIMINWLGYTDKEPDPNAGEIIHGGQW